MTPALAGHLKASCGKVAVRGWGIHSELQGLHSKLASGALGGPRPHFRSLFFNYHYIVKNPECQAPLGLPRAKQLFNSYKLESRTSELQITEGLRCLYKHSSISEQEGLTKEERQRRMRNISARLRKGRSQPKS